MNPFFEGFKNGFMCFGHNLAMALNVLLLLPVYFIGVGVSSVIARISGKELLPIKKKNKKTYWEKLGLGKQKIDKYYKQF